MRSYPSSRGGIQQFWYRTYMHVFLRCFLRGESHCSSADVKFPASMIHNKSASIQRTFIDFETKTCKNPSQNPTPSPIIDNASSPIE
jgi:hypothetical protein